MGKNKPTINYAAKAEKRNGKQFSRVESQSPNMSAKTGGLSQLQQKFKDKLEGGRFRFINGNRMLCWLVAMCLALLIV